MFKKLSVILFCTFVTTCRADLCQYNFTLAEFPQGILVEALSLILTGTLNNVVGCPNDLAVNPDDIHLWLYNQANPTNPILLDKNNPSQVDPSLPTIAVIPGWLCNLNNDYMPHVIAAYLQKFGNVNVIGVDWYVYSYNLYSDAFCLLPLVAEVVGKFFCDMHNNMNFDIGQLHAVGHSMGGQMSGIIGQEVAKQCGQVLGRITAADPAGPLYQTIPNSRRLDKNDATSVDVIHTNQAQLGFYGSCGKVDFFPNCGYFQPGCLVVGAQTNPLDLLNLPVGVVSCNHLRSVEYLAESVNSNQFVSTSCATCPGLPLVGPCIADLINPSHEPMGEPCPPNPPDTKYFLRTNDASPYARG